MPQMAPAMWETLYTASFMLTLMTLSKVFFMFNLTFQKIESKTNYIDMKTWLW